MAAFRACTNDPAEMMKPNPANAVGRVRLCGILEGGSFLLLLFLAMPLKYAFGFPLAVRYIGMAHGILFILFCLLILVAWLERKLPISRAAMAFGASLIPFGPFLIDRKLAEDEALEVSAAND